MPIVAASCTKCGAELEAVNTNDIVVCKYCRTRFVIRKTSNLNNSNREPVTAKFAGAFSQTGSSVQASFPDFGIINRVLIKYHGKSPHAEIPAGVKIIAKGAFAGCENLKSLYIPQSVTAIKEDAFRACTSLESFKLPDTITEIGREAFCGCEGLKTLFIPGSVKNLGGGAFSRCEGLRDLTLGEGITDTGVYTFKNCVSLSNLYLPLTLTRIGLGAFACCTGLENISLPSSLQIIEIAAFEDCRALNHINLPEGIGIGESLFCFMGTPYYQKTIFKAERCYVKKICFYCGNDMTWSGKKCSVCEKPKFEYKTT